MGKELTKQQETSPSEMIRLAVTSGADLEKLERLLTLQERFEANEARKAYHKAMAEFKENPPHIEKDKKVGFASKQGGRVGYSHASLGNVVEKITAELSKHGLSVSWRTQQNGTIIVTCRITHIMGHSEEAVLSAGADTTGSKNSIQALGSTISYLQRYTILSILGLATYDQDNDGQGAEVEYITENQLNIIREKLNGRDEAKFLAYLGVEKLELLPKADYAKAMIALQAKKVKK